MSAKGDEYPSGYTTAGRYEVVRRLGAGGMGSVYEAFDTKVERKIAIKFLAKELVNNDELRKRFEREAKAAGRIDHDNVCAVTDWGLTDEGVPFLVMELLKGESLADRLRRVRKLPAEQAVELMAQALSALAAAHVQGIVHRDLKPDNIFLTQASDGSERVKLVDFGIAKFIGGSGTATAHGAILGTLHYMSPEQAKGRAEEIDHRTDIWAAGVILYEALTGIAPFGRETMPESLAAIINDYPAPVHHLDPDIPEHVGLAIQHAMNKHAFERFGSSIEFAASLRGEASVAAQVSEYAATIGSGSTEGSGVSTLPNRDQQSPKAFSNSNVTVPATMVTSHGATSSRMGLIIGGAVALVLLLGLGITLAVVLAGGDESTSTATTAPPPPPPPQTPAKVPEPPQPEPIEEAPPAPEKLPAIPEPVALKLTGLPEGSTVSFNGAPVADGHVRGLPGQTGELVVEAPGHATLRMPLALAENGDLDLSDRLQPVATEATAETTAAAKASVSTTSSRSTSPASTPSSGTRRSGSYTSGRSGSKVILDYGSANNRRSGGYVRGRDRTKVSLDYPSQ